MQRLIGACMRVGTAALLAVALAGCAAPPPEQTPPSPAAAPGTPATAEPRAPAGEPKTRIGSARDAGPSAKTAAPDPNPPAGTTVGNQPPTPLPMEIVQAWRAAGAEVGWVRSSKFGFLEFLPEKDRPAAGDVPAFRFASWKEDAGAKLPAPAAPFGLIFDRVALTDAQLKAPAGFTRLHALGLLDSQVTDAGLKELAGLTALAALDLTAAPVTDKGVKELAGLKSLRMLYLYGSKVTQSGLKELRAALPGCKIYPD